MDRRTAFGTLCGAVLSGGSAAVIGATALGTGSPYFNFLIYGGVGAIVFGALGLLLLLIFPPKRAEAVPPADLVTNQTVTSHQQSGGITAHTVNFGPQPRRLDEMLKAEILERTPRSRPITVVAVLGDSEAIQFAQEIHAFLRNNGFPLAEDGVSQAVYTGPVGGLQFNQERSEFIVGSRRA